MKKKEPPTQILPGQPSINFKFRIVKFDSDFTKWTSQPEFVTLDGEQYPNEFKMNEFNLMHKIITSMNTEAEKYGILFISTSLSRVSSCASVEHT